MLTTEFALMSRKSIRLPQVGIETANSMAIETTVGAVFGVAGVALITIDPTGLATGIALGGTALAGAWLAIGRSRVQVRREMMALEEASERAARLKAEATAEAAKLAKSEAEKLLASVRSQADIHKQYADAQVAAKDITIGELQKTLTRIMMKSLADKGYIRGEDAE